jgi:hypothetical protein
MPMNLRAIKYGQTIQLLDPLDLPDGEITITVQSVEPEISDAPITFWDAMQKWRATIDWDDWDDSDPWEGVRDPSPGREFSWDD